MDLTIQAKHDVLDLACAGHASVHGDAELEAATHDVGHARVLRGSARSMTTAHSLYRSAGFTETDPYPESEIPQELQRHWCFMKLRLC